jgi:alkyl hydroperoxide reductase subunit F
MSRVDEAHLYEILIVGGGPVAMSTALYAVRKGLDVAVLTTKWSGQMTDTAKIENYLGLPDTSGDELTKRFHRHLAKYPLATTIGVTMIEVLRDVHDWTVRTDDERRFTARSIIYCAGQEYQRLSVPGEDRFLGHGIAFCATCNAPYIKGNAWRRWVWATPPLLPSAT